MAESDSACARWISDLNSAIAAHLAAQRSLFREIQVPFVNTVLSAKLPWLYCEQRVDTGKDEGKAAIEQV